MITQYYIAWESHNIFTSREEVIQDYIVNNYSYGYEGFLEDYLCNRYSFQEIFEMPDSEKEVVRKNLEVPGNFCLSGGSAVLQILKTNCLTACFFGDMIEPQRDFKKEGNL